MIIRGRAGTTLEQIYPQLPISYISLYAAVSAFLNETINMPSLQFPPKATLSAKGGQQVTPIFWLAVIAGFSTFALAVMWPRWGGTIEDSLAYFNTARYLRGDLAASELRAPFPYRIMVPALAAFLPGDVRNNFAVLNWLAVTGAACAMALSVSRVGMDKMRVIFAGFLLVLSVPTFWYAPYLLTDPGSVFARAVFVVGVVSGQPWMAALAGLFGTAVREENILLLVWLLAARRIPFFSGLVVLATAAFWMIFVRWYLITELPSYTWAPHLQTAMAALTDVRSLVSIVSAFGVVVPLAVLGWRNAPEQLRPLKSLLLLMALPPLYAALCVRVDGRAVWGLYPMLIPFALSVNFRSARGSRLA